MMSLTGTNWTTVNVGTTNDLFSAASSGSETIVVGRSELRSSPTPYTVWTSLTSTNFIAPPRWTYYRALWDGKEFLVGGRSGMFVEGFKPPGVGTTQWYLNSTSPRNWMWDLTRVGDIYVACGDLGGIFTSVVGFRFNQERVPDSARSELLEGVGGDTNGLVSVGTSGIMLFSPPGFTNVVSTNSTGVYTNEVNLLGLRWEEIVPRVTTNELQGVGVFGSKYIVSGGKGTILTSLDGQQWIPAVSGVTEMLSSVTASPERAVITGDFGRVLTSEDGIVWAQRSSGVTNWIYKTKFLNGQFVGVGEEGLILTSSDGLSWTTQTSGTTTWLNTVTYQDGNYYAAGGEGEILRSGDAITWTPLPKVTDKSIYGIASTDGQVVTAGIEGAALRTRVTPQLSPVNFISFTQRTNVVAFLFSGKMDQKFKVQRSPDFESWSDILELEILDNTGTLIYYDALISGVEFFFRTGLLSQ
jgi:hypothetical protein